MGETRFQPYVRGGVAHEPKTRAAREAQAARTAQELAPKGRTVVAQFADAEGVNHGPPVNVPADITPEQLQLLLNTLLKQEGDPLPYAFAVDDTPIVNELLKDVAQAQPSLTSEDRLTVVFRPQATFRVRPVARCTASLTGHSEAIVCCSFSPDGKSLATGSGDTTVRIWDLLTETPRFTLRGHTGWVQHVCWSPDGEVLVSAGMDGVIRLWNPTTGEALGKHGLKGHTQPITSLSFEPLHSNSTAARFCSASKDGTVRVWDCRTRKPLFAMAQHTQPVTCVRWGGAGLIYSASRDTTIRVWDAKTGALVRVLSGHAHWVNHLALSTDFVLRTGGHDHEERTFKSREEMAERALERYNEATHDGKIPERLASCSDDYTIFIWRPTESTKPVCRMTGHQQPVNHISFSPDGAFLASASFDKGVKLWDGMTGKFLSTLRGHVGPVYQVCWAPDSRMVLSGSRDATLKLWDAQTGKMRGELPGHSDEVFAVDWSPVGSRVSSGGKDRTLKIWRH